MSDSVDSTNPGGAAAGDAPPTKLSLRTIEAAQTGVTTYEENSLLGIGRGQGDPYIDSPWEQTESNAPQTDEPSFLPFRSIQAVPTEAISSSEPSHSGPSYTAPTQSVSHASNPRPEEVIQRLIHNGRSLSWLPEFSWQDAHLPLDDQAARLCFDGQPLELPATRDGQFSRGGPGSEHEFSISQRSLPLIGEPNRGHDKYQISGVAGVGGWFENNPPEKLEVASAICSVSTDISLSENSFKGEFIQAGLPAHVEIALQKTVDSIVETLVDDFCRSYAPQKQSLAAKRKLDDQSSNTSTKRSRKTTTPKGANPGSRKGQTIDGDGESEDEESSGNRHNPSGADTSVEQIRFLACPFMKWNPREYKNSCIKKLRDMHGLKKHVQEKHFVIHCPKCFMTPPQDARGIPPHPCIETPGLPTRPRPVGLVTMDMQAAIRERPGTRLSQKEKWERIFKIIFPEQPIPSNPYLDHEMALLLCNIENFVCQPSVKARVRHMKLESQLESEFDSAWKRIDELVFERLVPRILDVFSANVIGMNSWITPDQVAVDHAQSISTIESGIPDNSYNLDSRGFGSYQDETTTIQSSGLMEVDNTTTPAPELVANQPGTGAGEDLDRLESIDNYGSPYSDIDANMNFEEVWSDPFSRPGAGDTPWYGGQEMFEMGLDQMRGDETPFQWS
ncbi:hypothetical protein FPANT_13822 [Fusarium pseudoanthophilum]|uniref:C2H2-type domain-containing protein n=1 Tax=Fusarium pseudoanthophilum TaxID=48495 RepID=A0A8H5KB19_9HYPO|nr:hypothetical protein FPANT_13822 [Fusarium pseudoanthophilum]